MKTLTILLLAVFGMTACAGGQVMDTSLPEKIVIHIEKAKFGPCPPAVKFACEMAVLEGSPKSPGLFTMRIRTTDSWVLPPHSHPKDERVTVISGKIGVGFGTTVDKNAGETFSAGDYYVNPSGSIHYVWADEPVEIQITGFGPWEVHPYRE